ncbi:MAG: 2-hydroxyacid dehydrogenase [Niabella sp.]
MKVSVFSAKKYDIESFERIAADYGHEFIYEETHLSTHSAKLAAGSDAVCIFVNDRGNANVLQMLADNGVKIVVLRCAGFNQMDLEAAKALGMTVARVPAYSPQAVAEHALAMMLTLNRKTHKAYNRVREGNFSLERLVGFNINGKTIGIIGMGKIGLAFAKIMGGFGCTLLGYDPVVTEMPDYVQKVDLPELFAQSDIISLHCPLFPETQHIINQAAIEQMKPGVMIINTSRGGLVNTKDVIQGLKSGKVGHLGIDVYEQEDKLFFRDLSENVIQDDGILRLMSFPNVLITAHQGFFTREALSEIAHITMQNLNDARDGKRNGNFLV